MTQNSRGGLLHKELANDSAVAAITPSFLASAPLAPIGGSNGSFNLFANGPLNPAQQTKIGDSLQPIGAVHVQKVSPDGPGQGGGNWTTFWVNTTAGHQEAEALWVPNNGPGSQITGGGMQPDTATLGQWVGAIGVVGAAAVSLFAGGILGYAGAAFALMAGHDDLVAVGEDIGKAISETYDNNGFGGYEMNLGDNIVSDPDSGLLVTIQHGNSTWDSTDTGGWGNGDWFAAGAGAPSPLGYVDELFPNALTA